MSVPGNTEAAPLAEELAELDDLVAELRGHVEEQRPIPVIDGTCTKIGHVLFGIALKAGTLAQHPDGGWGDGKGGSGHADAPHLPG